MLEVREIHTYYGDSHVLQGVSLSMSRGQVVGILGRNGMGKTTLIRSIIGFTVPRRGKVVFKDRDITAWPSNRAVTLGLGLVPQGRRVFPSLTVMENLELGSYRHAARAGRKPALDEVFALFPILRERHRQLAGSLSGGEQQMLALGRGLMARPDLLLLDEPSQGLGPRIVEQIFETIDRIRRERRLTILLVEQRVVEALELCDRGYVLETGRVVLAGPREALLADARVQRAYLGA